MYRPVLLMMACVFATVLAGMPPPIVYELGCGVTAATAPLVMGDVAFVADAKGAVHAQNLSRGYGLLGGRHLMLDHNAVPTVVFPLSDTVVGVVGANHVWGVGVDMGFRWSFTANATLDPGEARIPWGYRAHMRLPLKPVVRNGVVYIGSGDKERDANYVYALNATTGERIWMVALPGLLNKQMDASPALGVLFVPSNQSVCALSLVTGSILWRATFNHTIETVYCNDGIVYAGDVEGSFYLLDATRRGGLVHTIPANASSAAYVQPVRFDDTVYMFSGQYVVTYNTTNRAVGRSGRLGAAHWAWGNGTLWVQTYGLKATGGIGVWRLAPNGTGELAFFDSWSNHPQGILFCNGKIIVSTDFSTRLWDGTTPVWAHASGTRGIAYSPLNDGTLLIASEEHVLEGMLIGDHFPTTPSALYPANLADASILVNGTMAFTCGKNDCYRVDADTGRGTSVAYWNSTNVLCSDCGMVLTGNNLFCVREIEENDHHTMLSMSGATMKPLSHSGRNGALLLGRPVGPPVVDTDGTVLQATTTGNVMVYDGSTGASKTVYVPRPYGSYFTRVSAYGGYFYVEVDGTLHAFSTASLQPVWTQPLTLTSAPLVYGGYVYVLARQFRGAYAVQCHGRETGVLVWRLQHWYRYVFIAAWNGYILVGRRGGAQMVHMTNGSYVGSLNYVSSRPPVITPDGTLVALDEPSGCLLAYDLNTLNRLYTTNCGDGPHFSLSHSQPLFVNGALYWSGYRGAFVIDAYSGEFLFNLQTNCTPSCPLAASSDNATLWFTQFSKIEAFPIGFMSGIVQAKPPVTNNTPSSDVDPTKHPRSRGPTHTWAIVVAAAAVVVALAVAALVVHRRRRAAMLDETASLTLNM